MKHRLWKKLNREARKYAHVQTEENGYAVFWGMAGERTWRNIQDFNEAKVLCNYHRRLYIFNRIREMRRENFKSKIVY